MTFPNGQNSPVSHRWDNLCEWASSRVILKHASLGSRKALTAHPHSQQAPLCLKSAVVLERKDHIAPQRAPQPPVVPPNHCFFSPVLFRLWISQPFLKELKTLYNTFIHWQSPLITVSVAMFFLLSPHMQLFSFSPPSLKSLYFYSSSTEM